MLYDFRPTGWKMTIILLQQPAINRAEEYMEWRAKWGLEGWLRRKMETRARVHNRRAHLYTRHGVGTQVEH